MLTVSKPTLFNPSGMAVRNQSAYDSPGWQLKWFDSKTPPVPLWQGTYKTCRHLQTNCASCTTLEEARERVQALLNTDSLASQTSMPTDVYQSVPDLEKSDPDITPKRKKKKKKR